MNKTPLLRNGKETQTKINNIFLNKIDNKDPFYTIDGIINELNVDPNQGLDLIKDQDIKYRNTNYQKYIPTKKENKSFFSFLIIAFSDFILQELFWGSLLGGLIGVLKDGITTGWTDSLALMATVVIISFCTALFSYKKEKRMEQIDIQLNQKYETKIYVKRQGHIQILKENELYTGDIIILHQGDFIRVPGILIKGSVVIHTENVKNQQEKISSNFSKSIIYPNSVIIQGEGEMIVTFYEIPKEIEKPKVTSNVELEKDIQDLEAKCKLVDGCDLKTEMNSLLSSLSDLAFALGIFVGVCHFIKTVIFRINGGTFAFDLSLLGLLIDSYIICEAIKVVAIPEGLPLAGRIAISFGATIMIKNNVIINNLDKIGALARINYLLVNKSTLFGNNYTVKSAFIYGETFPETKNKIKAFLYELKFHLINNLQVDKNKNVIQNASPFEKSILQYIIDNEDIQSAFQILNDSSKNSEIISKRLYHEKYDFTITIINNTKNKKLPYMLLIKGTTDIILKNCTSFIDLNGEENKNMNKIYNIVNEYNKQGYTLLYFARKQKETEFIDEALCQNLCLTAIFAFKEDIIVDENSINLIKQSGIDMKIINSEDNQKSIKFCKDIHFFKESKDIQSLIQKKIPINVKSMVKSKKKEINEYNMILSNFSNDSIFINEDEDILIALNSDNFEDKLGGSNRYDNLIRTKSVKKGIKESRTSSSEEQGSLEENDNEIYKLKDKETFGKLIPFIKLISNAEKEIKSEIISGIKEINPQNNIIGMTYEYTNQKEAESKHLVNITFSNYKLPNDMKEDAGDVLLLDHSLKCLLKSIGFGRNTYDSIRKFLQFQISITLICGLVTLSGSFMLYNIPFTPVQLMWINLIMDTIGAIALGTDEPNENELLNHKQYEGDLVNSTVIVNICTQALYQCFVMIYFILYGYKLFGIPSDKTLSNHEWNNIQGTHLTIVFTVFIYMNAFNLINSRKVHFNHYNVFRGIFHNFYFIFSFILIISVQNIIIYYGDSIFRTKPLSLFQQLICLTFGAFSLVVCFISKLFINKE